MCFLKSSAEFSAQNSSIMVSAPTPKPQIANTAEAGRNLDAITNLSQRVNSLTVTQRFLEDL